MKNSIQKIRTIRSTNIGAEIKSDLPKEEHIINAAKASGAFHKLKDRQKGFLIRYINDMNHVCSEIARVLKAKGKAIYVVGDSTIKGIFVSNSNAIKVLSEYHGLHVEHKEDRLLSENRRYLPPPSNKSAGNQLKGRMRKEVIMVMRKR